MARAGSWSVGGFKLPEFGITEKIQSIVKPQASRTAQGGSNLFGQNLAQRASTPSVQGAQTRNVPVPSGISPAYGGGGGSYSQTQATSYAPATSGQAADGGGGDEGGYDYIGALRSAFDQSRNSLQSILPTYDSDYSNFKSTIEGGINRAKDTLTTQNQEDERLFGQSLKSLLQSDKDLRQRRQGTFSALGALDSSQFRDETTQADQFLLESQQNLEGEKNRNYNERQKEYAAYEQQANSQIAGYANEISRAKASLQQAIASVNMDEAASIQNYISQLSQQAQQVNAQREAMALNLAQLQAQGTDVVGNLSKLNMGQFSNLFGQNLAKRVQSSIGRYATPTNQVNGSGFIGNGTQSEELRRLYGMA